MKNLKNFDDFTKQLFESSMSNGKIDSYAVKFLNDEITIAEFESYIFLNNEGVIGDTIEAIKQKVIDTFYTFLAKSYLFAKNAMNKFVSFMKTILSPLLKFSKKHPTTVKVIIMLSIIIIILIASAHSAQASTGNDADIQQLQAAIGYLEKLHGQPLCGGDTPEGNAIIEQAQHIINGMINHESVKGSDEAYQLVGNIREYISDLFTKAHPTNPTIHSAWTSALDKFNALAQQGMEAIKQMKG